MPNETLLERPPLEDLKWEDATPVERPPVEELSWDEAMPVVDVLPPSEFPPATEPRWEDAVPVDADDMERIQLVDTSPSELRPGTKPPPKTLWEGTKHWLRAAVSPGIGATQEQIDSDTAALLSADSTAVEHLFDEKGELTQKGKSAWDDLMRGVDLAQGAGYGLGMLGADLVGADRVGDWLLNRLMMNQQEIEENPPEVGSFANIGKGYGSGLQDIGPRVRRATKFATEAVGETLPIMAPAIVSGGGGGLVAKFTGAVGRRVAMAQAAGVLAGTTAMEAGSIYQDMIDQGTRGPIPALVSLGMGALAGTLDAIGPFLAIRRVGGEALKTPFENWLRSTMGEAFVKKGLVKFGAAAFENALVEGPTEWIQTAIEQAARLSQDPKVQGDFWNALWTGRKLQEERNAAMGRGGLVGAVLGGGSSLIGQGVKRFKNVAQQQAFEIGVKSALDRMRQPTEKQVTTQQGLQVSLPVEPSLARPARTELPPVAGVEGAAVVDQALSLGLERTAAALTGQRVAPLDMSAAQLERRPVEPPARPSYRQALARQVVSGMQPEPGLAAPATPEPLTAAQPPTIPPGGPVEPAVPVAQPAPAEATAGPAAVPGAPGVSPAAQTIPTAPTPQSGPAPAVPRTNRVLGLMTSLGRMFPKLRGLFDVVENADQFPEAVKADARAQGLDINSLDAFFYNGRVIFNADHFPTGNPQLVYEKATHETSIHLGLRKALGPQRFSRLAQQAYRGLSPQVRAQIARRNGLNPASTAVIGEEWLGYESERVASSGKTDSVWAAIVSALRNAARALRIPLKFSDVEIARLIAKGWRGAEAVAQAGEQVQIEPTTRFSIATENVATGIADIENRETEGAVETLFSVRDYEGWREDAVAQMTKGGRVDEATAQRWLDDLDHVTMLTAALAESEGLMEEFPIGRPARGLFSGPIQYNDPYIFSWDGSGTCTLRLPAQEYLNAVVDELSNRALASNMSPSERELIMARLVVAGMPRMCTACYVESRRALRVKYAGLWSRWLTGAPIAKNDLTDGMRDPKPEVVRARRRYRGSVRFEDIDQTVFQDVQRWKEAEADPNSHLSQNEDLYRLIHAQSISNANLVFERQSYTGQFRRLRESQRGRQELQGGLRFYSISDFLFEHAIDLLQSLADAASRGFPGHMYTKQPEAVQLLGQSNMKINLSWIPLVGKDGKLKEWQGQSFPWDEAVRLKRENPNIGIIFVAFNDEQIQWAMNHPDIGQIIPYHRSGMYKNQFDGYVKAQGWKNYETDQHVKIINPEKWARFEKEFRARNGTQYTPEWKIGWFLRGQAMTDLEIVTQALADADKYGFQLPFQKFMTDANDNPVAGAAKMLKDYARTDTPQLALQPVFDRSTFRNLMNAWAKPKALYGGKKANQIKVSKRLVNVMADDLETYRRRVAENPDYEGALWDQLIALQLEYAEDPLSALSSRKATAPIMPKPGGGFRASVAEGEAVVPEPTARGVATVTTPTGASLAPRSPVAVPDHDREFETLFSVTPLSTSNADVSQALEAAGFPALPETMRKPDAELLATVQRKMREDPSWVDRIVERETKKPGMLTDEEVLALNWWMLQLRTEFTKAAMEGQALEQAGRQDEAAVKFATADWWAKPLQKVSEVTYQAGTLTGRALRSRRLVLQEDFSLQAMVNKKRQVLGWRELTDVEMRDLAAKAAKYEKLAKELEAENRRLLERDVEAELEAARGELAQVNPAVLDYAKEWIDSYKRKATSARDRFAVKWNRLHPDMPMRASVQPGQPLPALPDELLRELAIMGGAKLAANITDATEWANAMVEETGEFIRPYLDVARTAAEAHLAAELAAGRAETARRRAPRKVPGAAPTAPRTPTVQERMAVTKAKIAQVVETRKTSTEPVKTAEDDLYYPVQRLVRELVEQDPLITRDELIDQVHQVLLESMPDITREQTMDAISGRGRMRIPSQETVDVVIRDLKAQTRLAAHILDVEAGLPLPVTGWRADKPSPEQRRLTQRLTEFKRKYGEVVTDPAKQLASYLDSRKTWYRNRMSDLRYEIQQRQLTVRTKMPGQTDAELEALKAEYDQVRQEHEAIFVKPDLTPEQRLVLAEAAAERIITKLESDLAEGRITANRHPNRLNSARLEAMRTRIVQLKAEQEWAQRHLNSPPDLKDPADIRRWFALDKSIRKIEQDLANQKPFGPGKKVRPIDTPTNQKMAARLEALKQERKEMRERLGPAKRSPLEQAIHNRMGQLRRQIADYTKRIAERDFAPRKRPEPTDLSSEPEAVKLLAERDRVIQDFYRELEKDAWETKTRLEKFWYGIRLTRQALANVKSSADLSALRQGLLAIFSLATRIPMQPIRMTKIITRIFWRMIRSALSRDMADEYQVLIKKRPNWESGADKTAKIEYSDIHGQRYTRSEETARSVLDEWAERPIWEGGKPLKSAVLVAPKLGAQVVAGSNRAFSTFLNLTRAALFDELLDINFRDRGPTDNELRIIGNWVNVATGRGELSPGFAKGAAEVIWSPKLLASRIQFLIGQPLWGGGALRDSARVRMIIAKEYARVIASSILLSAVYSLFDEKKEKSLVSSDVYKIVRGNTRVDLWGGLQQVTVLASRLWTGKTKTVGGREIDQVAAARAGMGGLAMILTNFARSKMRPDVAVAWDLLTRGGYTEPTVGGIAKDLLVPLPFTDIKALIKDRGWSEGLAIWALGEFGAGVSVYDPERKVERELRRTN
jgi:hypothetical protein